jgi:hypothetical protein
VIRSTRKFASWRSQLALLIALVVLVHAPFLGGGWMTDDFMHVDYLQRQTLGRVLISPDVFGYYRPVSQASLLVNLLLTGLSPFFFRLTSLLLHVGVICAAFVLACLLLGEGNGAFLATLAFALTPKAHTIAVLWISARPELLMSLFSLLAVIFWIRWDRGDGRRWLSAAVVCYLLAVLSKEPAVLLPILLLITPPGSWRLRRVPAAGLLVVSGVATIVLRVAAGARIPLEDAYYTVTAPIGQDERNAWNYLTRVIPSPAALWLFSGLAARRIPRDVRGSPAMVPLAFYAIAWFIVLLLPVLPLPGRSELYLYLPGFGLCLLAGSLADRTLDRVRPGATALAAGLCVLVLGGYQVSRALVTHDVLTFSAKLERALEDDDRVRHYSGVLALVPQDSSTQRLLRDSVDGYLDVALKVMLGRRDIGGAVAYEGEPPIPSGLRVQCSYHDGQVILRPTGL